MCDKQDDYIKTKLTKFLPELWLHFETQCKNYWSLQQKHSFSYAYNVHFSGFYLSVAYLYNRRIVLSKT